MAIYSPILFITLVCNSRHHRQSGIFKPVITLLSMMFQAHSCLPTWNIKKFAIEKIMMNESVRKNHIFKIWEVWMIDRSSNWIIMVERLSHVDFLLIPYLSFRSASPSFRSNGCQQWLLTLSGPPESRLNSQSSTFLSLFFLRYYFFNLSPHPQHCHFRISGYINFGNLILSLF